MKNHDPYCKCYYPALTDPETCTWCYVIRQVRIDEYFMAWGEGFGVGFDEGYEKAKEEMSANEDNDDMSLNKDIRAQRIQRGIDKWNEDIDIAYWQGYNNAMNEISEGKE